jgi:raffinose/stachyose/melibiose transport system substrate-binding protein
MTKLRTSFVAACLAVLLLLPWAAAQTELTIAHTMTGGAHRAAFDRIVDAFEALHPDIAIDQVVQDDDLYEDAGLITMLQSDDPPDIFYQWGGELVTRDARQGFAADLSEAAAAGGFADWFVDASWSERAGTMVDGSIYMLPNSLDVTTAIWYNTEIFGRPFTPASAPRRRHPSRPTKPALPRPAPCRAHPRRRTVARTRPRPGPVPRTPRP